MIDVISVKILNVLTNTSLQMGVLVSLVWLLMWAVRIKNARTRCVLWLMAVLSAGVLPLISVFMPKAELALMSKNIWSREANLHILKERPVHDEERTPQKSPSFETSALSAAVSENMKRGLKANKANSQIPAPQISFPFSVTVVVCVVWLFGVFLMSLRLAKGYMDVLRTKRRASEILTGPIAAAFADLKNSMELKNVAIFASSDVQNPISFGIKNPTVLMPNNIAERMSEAEARLVLSHELEHIKRHDYLINLAQRILGAFFFFHPLFHLANNNLTREREFICDDWVIQATQDRIAYARCLTTLMENSLNAKPVGIAVAEFLRIRGENDFSRRFHDEIS